MHKYKHSLRQLEYKSPGDASALPQSAIRFFKASICLMELFLLSEASRERGPTVKKKGGAYTATITVGGSPTISQQALMINARRREY